MAINSSVRWFMNTMPGAPVIENVAGGLINVLDACLINGFGSKTINTLVVASEVATATISGGHSYEKHAVIRIAGATPSELNGDWRIASVPDGSTLTFACPGLADGSATGTMTALRATPGYWEKSFSDTNKGAYRSTHPNGTGLYLRVDDSPTSTTPSPVRGYETMTGIDTGANPFPTTAQVANLVWRRATAAGAKPWTLVADERWFCLLVNFAGYDYSLWQFGDAVGAAAADAYAGYLAAHTTTPSYGFNATAAWDFAGTETGQYWARNRAGTIGPVTVERYGHRLVGAYPGEGEAYPAALNGGYLFHFPSTLHQGDGVLRGQQPALWQGLTVRTTLGADRYRLLDPGNGLDRALLVHASTGANLSYVGIDLWGPWR
jgi:hypothetical protein